MREKTNQITFFFMHFHGVWNVGLGLGIMGGAAMAVGGAVTGKYVCLLVLVNSFFFVCSIYAWCFYTL